jgi:hypothetical protein
MASFLIHQKKSEDKNVNLKIHLMILTMNYKEICVEEVTPEKQSQDRGGEAVLPESLLKDASLDPGEAVLPESLLKDVSLDLGKAVSGKAVLGEAGLDVVAVPGKAVLDVVAVPGKAVLDVVAGPDVEADPGEADPGKADPGEAGLDVVAVVSLV